MEFMPRLFPSWFPRSGSDEESCRVLWLSLMGALQITIGIGLFLTMNVFPAISRAFSSASAHQPEAIGLPAGRSVTTR